MRFSNYLAVICLAFILGALSGHFVITSIASFVSWTPQWASWNEWSEPARLLYLIFIIVSSIVGAKVGIWSIDSAMDWVDHDS